MLMALTLAAGTLTACGGSAATAPAESAQTGTTAGTEAGSREWGRTGSGGRHRGCGGGGTAAAYRGAGNLESLDGH